MKPGTDYVGVSVGALILNDKDELFLTKRGERATNERGTWEIPGGKVNFGETLLAAAKREIWEEYGAEVVFTHQFPAQNHLIPEEHQHWVPTCFVGRFIPGSSPRILEPEKCSEIGWFALNHLPEPLSIITTLDVDTYRRFLSGDDLFAVTDK